MLTHNDSARLRTHEYVRDHRHGNKLKQETGDTKRVVEAAVSGHSDTLELTNKRTFEGVSGGLAVPRSHERKLSQTVTCSCAETLPGGSEAWWAVVGEGSTTVTMGPHPQGFNNSMVFRTFGAEVDVYGMTQWDNIRPAMEDVEVRWQALENGTGTQVLFAPMELALLDTPTTFNLHGFPVANFSEAQAVIFDLSASQVSDACTIFEESEGWAVATPGNTTCGAMAAVPAPRLPPLTLVPTRARPTTGPLASIPFLAPRISVFGLPPVGSTGVDITTTPLGGQAADDRGAFSPQGSDVGALVGGLVGGLAGAAVLAAGGVLYAKRRRRTTTTGRPLSSLAMNAVSVQR